MLENPHQVILDFVSSVMKHYPNITITAKNIEHELLLAPHCHPKFPDNKDAVYVFSLAKNYHISSLVGFIIKIGKAQKSDLINKKNGSKVRFETGHYVTTAKNSAAKSLNNNPILWDLLSIPYTSINSSTIMNKNAGDWLKENTDRDHFFINSNLSLNDSQKVMCLLEVYLRGTFGSFLEGTPENR